MEPQAPYPILYSFRRCPYAIRARMALYQSTITCELREVVLADKPAQMLALSPKGTVPVLQRPDGVVIEESFDIMLWALSHNDPNGWLQLDQSCLDLIERNDFEFKTHLDRYKYPNRFEGTNPIEARFQGESFLKALNLRLGSSKYLHGEKVSIADVAIAPFVRQFAHVNKDWFDQTPYTALQDWLDAFLTGPHFAPVMKKYAPWKLGDDVQIFGQGEVL